MNSENSFGVMVKSRRMVLGMSQAALADLVGRSASAIRSWERGSSTPTDEDVVQSLSAVLGIEEEVLRESVGLPPIIEDDSETVGGASLETFVGEPATTGTEPGSDEPPAGDGGVPSAEPGEEAAGDTVPVEAAVEGPDLAEPPSDDLPPETGEEVDQAPDYSKAAPVADEGMPAGIREKLVQEADELPTVPLVSSDEVTAIEPIAAPVAAARTARTQIVQQPPAPAPRSYLEDPDQMTTYWVRAALTVALTVFLLIVLFWALGRLGDSLGEVWELFKAGA